MKKELFIDLSGLDALKDTNLPDPSLLEYYKLLNNRSISINYDIADDIVEYSHKIIEWNREDKDIPIDQRKAIKIFVNTNGGCLNSILCLINVIKLSKTPVYTIGMGKVYSAGGLLLMAGHKRFILEDTTFLLHDGSSGAVGSIGKLMDGFEFTQKTEKRVKEYVLANTSIGEELYDKNYRRDWFMLSDEIIDYSIADSIIADLDILL